MKILAFSSSNNAVSINRILAEYVAGQVKGAQVEVLDINDYELPIFSEARESALGQPALAKAFLDKIQGADGLVIAHAEHNGTYTAAYKNLYDRASRQEREVFQGKPALLLSTSPGPGGAKSVLRQAEASAPYQGVNVIDAISVPDFTQRFCVEKKEVKDESLMLQLQTVAQAMTVACVA